jgi:ACS family hexuronate transporter-like MFS transporter
MTSLETPLLRWLPTLSMTLVSIVSYVDRNALAVLAPMILRDLALSNQQYGYLISAFSAAYVVSSPIWGRLIDQIGVRIGMLVAVLLWTLASVSHAYAVGFVGLFAARALLGLGEGATFPGCLRTVAQTLPVQLRAKGMAIAYSGASVGALVAPLIVTPIAVAAGWRSAFLFTGILGALWFVGWSVFTRHTRWTRLDSATPTVRSPNWNDRGLWAFIAVDALGSFPSAVVNFFAANYLHSTLGTSQLKLGTVLWIPPLGWELGYFFWGWLTDRATTAGRTAAGVGRQLVLLALLGLSTALVPWSASLGTTLALMWLAMFVSSGFIVTATAYRMSASPRHVGLLGGVGAGSSALIVAVMMPVIGRLFDVGRFAEPFVIAAAFPVVGVTLWHLLSSESAEKLPPAADLT